MSIKLRITGNKVTLNGRAAGVGEVITIDEKDGDTVRQLLHTRAAVVEHGTDGRALARILTQGQVLHSVHTVTDLRIL